MTDVWRFIIGLPFIVFCASLGPLADWDHERWRKTLRRNKDND